MSFRWLLAAALIAATGTVSAEETAPATASPKPSVEPTGLDKNETGITTGNYRLENGGSTVIAMPDEHGNPVLTTKGARLEATRIVYDRSTSSASAVGEVKVDFAGMRIIADGADYRADLRKLDTGRLRMGKPPILLEAGQVSVKTAAAKVETSTATLEHVKIYHNEPDFGVISVSADRIKYDSKANTITADDIVVRVGPIPVLWLPSYEQEGLDAPPLDPEIQFGSNNRYGVFIRTTTFYTANPRWQPGLLLDGYAKAGVLAGPALRYNTAKVAEDAPTPYNLMKGDIRAGFIEDHSNRGTDIFGRPVPEFRHFVEWTHKQTIGDTVEITNLTHWWSDPLATRDLRRKLFNENRQPDNFVELVVPDRAYYASVFARYNPNEQFQDINQRLPEVRFDLNPREIADTRIYQRGYVSLAYLREEISDELPVLPGTASDTLATPRVDAYYGLTRPVKPDAAFSITPVAGVRSTSWFDAMNGDPTYSRLAGQVGFDAQANAYGKWDYADPIWEIDGLRHRLRPLVQYRYLPGATDGAGRIPQIDRWSFLTAPPPIDLSQRRDTDDLHETQILRLGLENIFETRAKDYGSRDLVGLDVYQDFRDTNRPGERTLSDTYLRQRLTPAPWLDFELFQRISPYSGALHEISTQTVITDGDRWKIRFGTHHVTDATSLEQYMLGWEYRINSLYTFSAMWRYDADTSSLAEQRYGIVQQLGNSWQLEYFVGHNRNARSDSGLNLGVNLRLNTF